MRARCVALFVFVLLFTLSGHACSCAGTGTACGAMKPGGTLFLGEVTGQRSASIPVNVPGEVGLFTMSQIFRLRVVEPFSGAPRAGEEVEVRTGSGGGDCGFHFVVGRRYLVDAYSTQPGGEVTALRGVTLGTSICSRTREEGAASIALRELRTGLTHGRQPDLHGSVRLLDAQYAYPGRPLPGIGITLTARADGAVYRAQTDAAGIYTYAVLPPGDYSAIPTLLAHQTVITYSTQKTLGVTIPANDGTGLACHLDANVGPSGGLRVRVVDRNGTLLQGSVVAHRLGAPREEQGPGSEWSDTGRFVLRYLADGEYQLNFSNYSTKQQGTGAATVRDGAIGDEVVIVAAAATR